MADVTIKYKGSNIATMDASGTKTLNTSGKYCEGDVQVVYADPEKPTQSKTVTPTASGFTVSPDSGKVLSSVVINGDADLIASNVRSGKNIFGVDGTLVEGVAPSGNKAITATTSTQTGIDVTDYATVSVAPTPSETKSVSVNGDVTPTSGKLLSKVTVNVPTGTARTSADLTASGATVTVPAGLYSAQATKSVASGSAGTPSASKGTVSNHSVTVTPYVTNTTGYITGGTKNGTGVSVSASELVSGTLDISDNGNGIDVTNYQKVNVNVSSGGGGKAAQASDNMARVAATSYTSTNVSLTVEKTGTYTVRWYGYRSSTSGTNGSQLYIGNTAYGSAQTTFSVNSNGQTVKLTGVSLTAGQTITVRARSRSTSYYMFVMGLSILEE